MAGTLFVVATPIGNLEDITARALRVLREVAVIAAEDTRRTAHLLAHFAIRTPTTSLHEHNEQQKTDAILGRLQRGEDVALVSDAGTPTISDPGYRLVRAVADAGLRVESVPGPSALLAALAASGLPGDAFTFLGFPPNRSKDRNDWFERLKTLHGTVVFYESPHRIRPTLEQISLALGDCYVVIGRELTKIHEELVRGPISSVVDSVKEPRGEYVVVIDKGQMTDVVAVTPTPAADIAAEFWQMSKIGGMSRRNAISSLARKYGRPAGEIYKLLEEQKKLVE